MSYVHLRVEEASDQLEGVRLDPVLKAALQARVDSLAKVLRAVEWAASGDTAWEDAEREVRDWLGPAPVQGLGSGTQVLLSRQLLSL